MLKKPLLLALGGVAIAAVAAAAFLFLGPGGSDAVEEEEVAEQEPATVQVAGKLGPHITLEDRVFTLLSPVDAPRYAKLQIVLEFETEDPTWFEISGEALERRLEEFREEIPVALLEDAITSAVSSKTVEDLATPEGKDGLREDIRIAVDALLPEPHVRRVLFTNFITQ
jgi:flagellar FliL protein